MNIEEAKSVRIVDFLARGKAKIYRERTKREIVEGAFGRWRGAGRLDY